ncbi:MAG TPA: hypothetical protein VII34_10755 [Pyrinomonadaceae bacterium]
MPIDRPPTDVEAIKALNYQGAFFKKEVLRRLSGKLRVAEEIGARFGQTRVADAVAYDGQGLFLVVECKKVAMFKKWVFMKHLQQRYRRSRTLGPKRSVISILDHSPPPHPLVCSEGFEVGWSNKAKAWRADQDPIFQAAAQLSAAYLGFIGRRLSEQDASSDTAETFVPVLVTNAKLAFVQSNFVVNEETGEADSSSKTEPVPYILLRHPYPQIENGIDFRDGLADDYQQRYQETIYVVNIGGLNDFLSDNHRTQLREPEPGINAHNFL